MEIGNHNEDAAYHNSQDYPKIQGVADNRQVDSVHAKD